MAIEVFRTNIETESDARMVVAGLHRCFADYQVNFDLEDPDRVLRIKSGSCIRVAELLNAVKELGFEASVLPDTIPSIDNYFDPPKSYPFSESDLVTHLLGVKVETLKN